MSAIDAVGRTPMVRLEHLVHDGSAEVWVKLEGANPTGSYKDRMALAMIGAAERDGRLAPGQPVVEYTGGSTGSSLAFVCAVRGHPLRIAGHRVVTVQVDSGLKYLAGGVYDRVTASDSEPAGADLA